MTRYSEAFTRLNKAQKTAVQTTEGPVLVIAGPGTGKTQLLTTRIAHILATTDTLPQNILCLTFTESAALNMQERLATLIGRGAYDVTISTYHGFGSSLIRNYPEYFADEADPQPIDDLASDAIIRKIIAGLPFSNPLKYSEAYIPDIKALISDSKKSLLQPNDLEKIARQNLEFIQKTSPKIAKALSGMLRITKNSIPVFTELATVIASDLQSSQPDINGSILPLKAMFIKSLLAASQEAEATGKTQSLTLWKKDWLAKNAQGEFVVDGTKANQKLVAFADVYRKYLQELKDNHLFDYDDMILRAVRALEKNSDLRYTLQEQYLYILLDEFQDTNGAQLRIVELLTDNPASEGRPNVLAVGDDDQAIYAFQGADYSHMLRFKDLYRNVLPVPLTENYRSHADILHTARGIAEQIEERLHHHFPQIEKTLTAEAKNLPKNAIIERREAQSDVMQYAWTAKKINQLIGQGTAPEDIAVLAPQHKYLEPLVPFLQQYNIPVRYEKREDILEDPITNELLRMSELCLALAKKEQAKANALWAEILSYEFWHLPTSLIWELSWQANEGSDWTKLLMEHPDLKPIALFFIRLSQIAHSENLETILDYLIGSSPLDLQEPGFNEFKCPFYEFHFGGQIAAKGQDADFWNVLTNLVILRSKLRDYKKTEERLTLKDFLEFAAAHREAGIKILNTSPYATGDNAVELMTAFKAKGLEWKSVFLLAVNDEAWGNKSNTASSRISLPPNLEHIRYGGASNDERLRLFYVAITRAKSQLYLVSYNRNYSGKSMTRLKCLDETTSQDGEDISPHLPQSSQRILPAEDGATTPTTELAAYWQQRHQTAIADSGMQAMLKERLRTYQLSPTHVNSFTDVIHCGPQQFFMDSILRFPQAPRPEIQFGNAIHETLEWIHHASKKDGKLAGEDAIFKTYEKYLRDKRLSSQHLEQFMERGKIALQTYLEQRGHTISADNSIEHNFRNEGVFIGDTHMAGKIDKMIIDRKAKTIQIVDYKTGKSYSHWTREAKLHKYQHQLYLYRALVEGSHTFKGYRVTDAYLEFVEPDEEGIIQELHQTFDEEDFLMCKQLAQAVWAKITGLDLPDISGYTTDLKGIEKFEQDLIDE